MSKEDLFKRKTPKPEGRVLARKILAGLTVVALLLIMWQAAYATMNQPSPLKLSSVPYLIPPGSQLPDFSLKGIDGKTYRLSDYRGKKMVLVEFFSTRCPHCQRSAPFIEAIYQKNKEKLEVLSINIGDDPAEPSTAKAFHDTYGITYPLLDDPPMEMAPQFKVQGFPTFYLVDKQGRVAWAYDGEMTIVLASTMESALN